MIGRGGKALCGCLVQCIRPLDTVRANTPLVNRCHDQAREGVGVGSKHRGRDNPGERVVEDGRVAPAVSIEALDLRHRDVSSIENHVRDREALGVNLRPSIPAPHFLVIHHWSLIVRAKFNQRTMLCRGFFQQQPIWSNNLANAVCLPKLNSVWAGG